MGSWWQKALQWLLSVDVPGDAVLSGVESNVRNPWAVALTAGFLAASALLILVLYVLEAQKLGLLRRLCLAALRTGVVAVLFFLLFRPLLLIAVFKGQRPRGIALLLDNTQSMTQKDRRLSPADKVRVALANNLVPLNTDLNDASKLPSSVPERPSRLEMVQAVLVHPELNLQRKLEKFGPMRTFLFGTRVHRLVENKGEETLAEALKGDEPRTALADGINEVLLRGDGDLPAALVLMTDGVDNASKAQLLDVARECKRLGVPLHLYGVGSSEAGTLQLRDVTVPDVLFADDAVAVPVRWKALGMKGGTFEIVATLGGKEVARKEVPAINGEDLRETLTFIPPKSQSKDERLELVTTVRLKGNAEFADEVKRPTRLIDRKIKLLYVENSPRWEYKFLQMNLLRDPRVEPSYLLVHGDDKALASGPPFLATFPATRKDLFAYDLLILGDVSASYLGPEHMTWIADFVKEGGGLIHIAGQQNAPSSWHGTPLEALLPIEFEPMRFKTGAGDVRPQVFQPALTLLGERHDLMSLADTREDNLRTWRELPGLYWHYPVNRLRPGASSLLVHPTEKCKNSDELMPLIALQYAGKGLVICLTTDETWRWRFNTQEQLFSRFWSQAIYLAGLSHSIGSKQTQLMLDRSEIVMGRPIQVFARLFDVNYQPLVQKSVVARLEHLDAAPGENRTQTVELLPVSGQPGEYRATLPNDRVGRFALRTGTSDTAPLEYRVMLPAQHELAITGLAKDALEEAAAASGGAFYREEDLAQLAEKIKPQSAPFTIRQPLMPLNPLAFLLFVFLITTEWVVRKFSNLS